MRISDWSSDVCSSDLISGYGQTGPYRDRAAFGVIGEAIGGLRHLTDHPPGTSDLPPVRVGVSIGDSVSGLYAVIGVLAALWQRDRGGGDGKGRTIDVALTERSEEHTSELQSLMRISYA